MRATFNAHIDSAAKIAVALAMGLLAGLPQASAQHAADLPSSEEAMTAAGNQLFAVPEGIRVTVGAMAVYQPKYDGAKRYEFSALPVFGFAPIMSNGAGGGLPFDARALDDVSLALVNVHGFEAGPLIGYRAGRAEKDSPRLTGLGDIDGGLAAGGYARYNFGAFYVRGSINQQLTGTDTGYLLRFATGSSHAITPKIVIKGVVTLDYGSSDYMQAYYGVTALQSSRSGLAVYDAGAGLKSIGALLSTEYALTADWTLLATAGYTRFLGDAASSPIVESADRFEVRLGAQRSFDWRMH